MSTFFPLREKYPNTEFFLVRILPHWDLIRRDTPYSVRMQENTNQKKLRIWTLFTQSFFIFMEKRLITKFIKKMLCTWWSESCIKFTPVFWSRDSTSKMKINLKILSLYNNNYGLCKINLLIRFFHAQLTFTCSMSTTKILEKGGKYV